MAASPSKTFPPPFSMSSCYFSLYSCILLHHQTTMISISLCFFFISTLIFSLSIIIFSFKHNSKKQNYHHGTEKQETQKPITDSSVDDENDSKKTDIPHTSSGSDPTPLSHLLLLELLKNEQKGSNFDGVPVVEEEEKKQKRKKRGKKKRPDSDIVCGAGEERKEELVCLYPFTKSTSATQRKIKQQYDQLVKSHESNGLTLSQVGQFGNCLAESKKELQHRSEVMQRKFTITKALLLKADRSSFDRLRQQIYKIELEQKRLEEDAFVYNWLQQQLKLSPAYKKMLEIGACVEMKAKSCDQTESIENVVDDISFEELLAQEKKDAFWQRNGKSKSCS